MWRWWRCVQMPHVHVEVVEMCADATHACGGGGGVQMPLSSSYWVWGHRKREQQQQQLLGVEAHRGSSWWRCEQVWVGRGLVRTAPVERLCTRAGLGLVTERSNACWPVELLLSRLLSSVMPVHHQAFLRACPLERQMRLARSTSQVHLHLQLVFEAMRCQKRRVLQRPAQLAQHQGEVNLPCTSLARL